MVLFNRQLQFRGTFVSTTSIIRSITFTFVAGTFLLLAGCNSALSGFSAAGSSKEDTAEPTITSASSESVLVGDSFNYQIVATNQPTEYNASGLPAGLIVDQSTGMISGSPQRAGQYEIELYAENAAGQNAAQLYLTIGEASGTACNSGAVAPQPAQSAGYTSLVFCDDFNSISTIDVNATGDSGYSWYPQLPGQGYTSPSAYSVSNGVLTLTSNGSTANWGLSTLDPQSGNGHDWVFALMEARISFDPTLGPESAGFPAVWAFSAYHAQYNNTDIWPELDIFEAHTQGKSEYSGDYWGTIHQWQNSKQIMYQNSNNDHPVNIDWNQWHIVSVLWTPGHVAWYLDNVLLMTQEYSASQSPSPAATTHGGETPTPSGVFEITDTQTPGMELILGSSPGWPLKVDWVRVWQQ